MTADICQWELTFRFRNEDRCKRFIRKLLNLSFTITFTYSSTYDDGRHFYQLDLEGYRAKNLRLVTRLMECVDYKEDLN